MRRILMVFALALSACDAPEPPPAAPVAQAEAAGRPETQSIQAADAVGYDGTAIRGKVDAALDQNEQRAADIDTQIEAQNGDAVTPEQP